MKDRIPHELRRFRAPVTLFAPLVVIVGAAFAVLAPFDAREDELPIYWAAPAFALIDQEGDTVRSSDLDGAPWVASFIFTNCTDVCPLITTRMAALRDSLRAEEILGAGVRLVSFTVDPARDTPEALREYAARFGASPSEQWAFLTGTPPEAIRDMIQQGFHLTAIAVPEHAHAGGSYQVMHSPRVLLVGAEGRVRGLYDVTEPDAMQRLHRDLRRLLRARAR